MDQVVTAARSPGNCSGMPRRMGARYERQPSRLEMKKLFLIGSIALSVLSASAAHASAHLTFLECGPYSIVNVFAAPGGGDRWINGY